MTKNIRRLRKLHGLKISELAEKIGVDLADLKKWERGLDLPDKEKLNITLRN